VEPAQLMDRALAAAGSLGALSPAAFAQSKAQIRQVVSERLASRVTADRTITEIWAKPETLQYMRDYVAKTLKK